MNAPLLPEHDLPRPLPQSYWIVPGHLLAGPCLDRSDPASHTELIDTLLDCGVRGIVNLMEEGELGHLDLSPQLLAERAHRHFNARAYTTHAPIPDMGVPSHDGMRATLDALDTMIAEAAGVVYLHCRGGFGRTGTVAGCWLVRHGYASGQGALTLLTQLRTPSSTAHRSSPETEQQRSMVIGWQKGW